MADEKNYFLYRRQYPDFLSILTGRKLNLTEFSKDAVFVFDTNSLLVPFNLGQESLNEIKRIYQQVLKPERVFVTAHTLREFAKNRSSKISELFTEVDKALSTIPNIKELNYPILGDLEAYKKLVEFRRDFANFMNPYKDILKNLQTSINEWNWFDPVTQLYNEVFTPSNIIDTVDDELALTNEFEQRMKDGIPPGNKDESKDINAIGDFLIWKSILEFGKKRDLNIVFVTNDEKNDWMLKGNKKSISTKFELVDEYCRFTGGKLFTCLNFADFLKIQGALPDVVTEVAAVSESNTTNDIYITIENNLKLVKKALNSYLADFMESDNNFIRDESFESTARELLSLLATDNLDVLRNFRGVLNDLERNLNSILSLNYAIHYQSIRMKRNTFQEQSELRKVSRQTIVLIDEIEFLL